MRIYSIRNRYPMIITNLDLKMILWYGFQISIAKIESHGVIWLEEKSRNK
jgi:hypothetical protein